MPVGKIIVDFGGVIYVDLVGNFLVFLIGMLEIDIRHGNHLLLVLL